MISHKTIKFYNLTGGGSNVSMIVMISIAVALLVTFITWSIIRDKLQKKKIKKQREELDKIAKNAYIEAVIDINALIEYNQSLLDSFVVSIGDLKMSDITTKAGEYLKTLHKTDVFENIYKNNPDYADIYNSSLNLSKIRSNMWSKKAEKEIALLIDMKTKLEIDEKDLKIKSELALGKIKQYYRNESAKNEKL